jgi:TrmH family RNA methyltransferase
MNGAEDIDNIPQIHFLRRFITHPIKLLKTKKGRDESGLFIIEGDKFVREISEHWTVKKYLFAKSYADTHDTGRFAARAECETLRDSLFDSLSDTATPQGIMAVCEQKHFTLAEILTDNCLLLIGEELSDPGNIGTLIRTASAAGADGVILTTGSAELYNPKVLRAAAGAVFHIKVITDISIGAAAAEIKSRGASIYAAHPRSDVLPYSVDLRGSVCLTVGNEARGLTDEALSLSDGLITLPMPGYAESLNASVAGAVLLYEAVRQRLRIDN